MKTESNQMKTDSTQMKTDSTQMKADSTQMKADSTQMKTDSNQMKADSTQMKTDSTQMKADSTQMKADSTQMKTDSNQMKADSTQMKTDSNQMKTDSTQMKADSTQMKTDSNQMKTDSTQMKADSNQMKTDSNQMKTDSTQMKADSTQIKADSNQMKTDSTQMKTLYDDNGYLTSVDVLQEEQLLHALQEYAKLEEKFGKEYTQYSLHNVHLEYEWVMNLTTHPNLLEAITAVLGPNVILLDSRFICKYPARDVPHKENTAPYVAWHQDIKYWGFEGGPVASVWLAFDDVDAENGVLQIIPGSHKQGILEHRVAEVPGNMLTANQEIPKHLVNAEDLVECPLKAGQMSVHDGLTVHASEPNMSDRRRCGFVIRYVPTTAYPVQDPERPRTFPATVLVAGTNEYNHFQDHAPNFFTKTL